MTSEQFSHACASTADDVLSRFAALAGPQYHDHEIIHEPFLTESQVNAILNTLTAEFINNHAN